MTETLAAALEREHREIDEGLETYRASRLAGEPDSAALLRAIDGLRRHIYLEEALFFPPLRSAGLVGPVLVMLREHGEMWRLLDGLETEVGRDPGGDTAAGLLDDLVPRLAAHNVKEERILYPQADGVLDGEPAEQLRVFMATGRMPPGWVCEMARPDPA